VAALLLWEEHILLCRQEKPGREYWLLPGGGVEPGEPTEQALRRELQEELDFREELAFEGPIAVADSIAPHWQPGERHVIHIVFGVDCSGRSLEHLRSADAAVRGLRLFTREELEEVVLHPPIKRFVQRWRPGDPAVYLGSVWSR
jgi:ADP-ribose pyrophosphatase YjhB (NUDIX family)